MTFDLRNPNPTNKRYDVILADPAWHTVAYTKERSGTPRRIKGDHYDTMTVEEMKDIPIDSWANAKSCALFMWVIDTHLEQAFDLAKAWGFRYSSIAFAWRKLTVNGKDHFGMGKTTRKGVELCLLFFKGTPPVRRDAAVRQYFESPEPEWIDAAKREHSRKPDEIYSRIERLYEGERVELFSKTTAPGWDVAGNQTDTYKIGKKKKKSSLDDLFGEEPKATPVKAKKRPVQPPFDGQGYEIAKGRRSKRTVEPKGIEAVLETKRQKPKKKSGLDELF